MTDFKLGGLGFTAPNDYRARMLVIAAPQKEGPKMPGQMVVKQQSNFARNVVVACEDLAEGMDIKAYSEKQVAQLKQSMPNFQILKEGTLMIGGTECPMFEAQSTGPQGRLLNSMTAYYLSGRTAFTLSASHLAGLPYQDTRKEYLSIIQSFKAD